MIINFDHNPLHHGTLGAIRSLGRAGVPVHLVQERRGLPVGRSRYVHSEHAWPVTLRGAGDAVVVLRELAARISGRPVVLPVDDAGAIFLAEHADALVESYDLPRQQPQLARRLLDKHSLVEICAEAGVAHPETLRPRSWQELITTEPPGGRWPVVLKQATPWIESSVPELPRTVIVRDRSELAGLASRATAADPGLLLQEYLPPSPGGDWFFHGYYDAGGTVRFGGTGVKVRSWPAYAGFTVLGRSMANPAVHRAADTLLRSVGYSGIVDIDLRLDPSTGRYHVLDVNPRLGAQHRLFRSAAGIDVARAFHLDLTGRAIPAAPPAQGRTFLVENFEPATARRYLDDGHLDVGTWWRSIRSVDEFAWFAGDDPLPFAAMIVRSAAEGLRNRIPALRRRPARRPALAARVTTFPVREPRRPESPRHSARVRPHP